jgi:membrane protease YdiL (CAAX protease family)
MKISSNGMKPISWQLSVILTIIPSGLATFLIYFVIPREIERTGTPFLYYYLPWWIGYMAIYLIASLVGYQLEGNAWDWQTFKARYRLQPIRGKSWWWLWLLLVTFVIAILLANILGPTLSSVSFLQMPSEFPPELNPNHPDGMRSGIFMGVALKGRWWIVAVYFAGWLINIIGEELWFRGHLLPRQELEHGDRAWIIHGIIWGLNHIWQRWTLVILFPYAFLWSYVIQKGKNTRIPIIVHGLGNLIPLVVIVMGVLG